MALGFGWNLLGGALVFRSPCARRKEGKCEMGWRLGGQVPGWLQDAAATPGRPWRVACALRRAATGGAMRHRLFELVGHVH